MLILLAGGAAAAAAYELDRAQTDRIAPEVSIGGVEVGGRSVREARSRVNRRLLPYYRRPLVIAERRRHFVLEPSAVRLRLDVDRAVAIALAKSRRGSFLHRVYRELRQTPLRLDLAPRVRYSPHAVNAFVGRIGRVVSIQPRDARFVASLRRPRLVPSRNGLAVRRPLLAATIRARLLAPGTPRLIDLPTRVLVPKETTARLARRYRYFIGVSRAERRLRLFEHLRLAKTYVIAVGRIGLETPAGLYRIDDKQTNPSWHVPRSSWAGSLAGRVIPPGPDDPLKARWLGFYDGSGIHGTDNLSSLGTAASHGCIRMSIPDVIELYGIVPLHTPIYIR